MRETSLANSLFVIITLFEEQTRGCDIWETLMQNPTRGGSPDRSVPLRVAGVTGSKFHVRLSAA